MMEQGHIAEWVWCFEHRFELCVKAALGLNILASLRSRVSALISVLRRPLVVNSYITEQLKFRLPWYIKKIKKHNETRWGGEYLELSLLFEERAVLEIALRKVVNDSRFDLVWLNLGPSQRVSSVFGAIV